MFLKPSIALGTSTSLNGNCDDLQNVPPDCVCVLIHLFTSLFHDPVQQMSSPFVLIPPAPLHRACHHQTSFPNQQHGIDDGHEPSIHHRIHRHHHRHLSSESDYAA